MSDRYYQDELHHLRENGREFARIHPDAARHLAEVGADPDVERLLEGVAFLTGRIRQQLDEGLPEITHALIDAFLPQYLRPVPAMTIVQFSAAANQRGTVQIPAGALIDAPPLDGTQCRFRTVHAVPVTPLAITRIEIEAGPPPRLLVRFTVPGDASPAELRLGRVRLHLGGDPAAARALLLCLVRNDGVVVEVDGITLPIRLSLAPAGFAPEESLLPHAGNAAEPHRLLLEWFAFPQRFLAVDLHGLDGVTLPEEVRAFTVAVACATHARHLPPVNAGSLLLHAVPAMNLFPAEAEPITVDGRRDAWRVRPAGGDPRHLGVFAVTGVEGRERGGTVALPFARRLHRPTGASWQERRRRSMVGSGADVDLLVDMPPGLASAPVVLSLTVLATNRDLPTRLGIGDLRLCQAGIPAGIAVRNLLVPTAPVEPALSGDLHWRLLAHLNLDSASLLNVEGLRGMLALYDLRAAADQTAHLAHRRLVEAIAEVRSERATRHLDGIPIRGLAVTVGVDEELIGGCGEAHLLGSVLDGFIAGSVSLNSFTRLTVQCLRSGATFAWPDRLGRRKLL